MFNFTKLKSDLHRNLILLNQTHFHMWAYIWYASDWWSCDTTENFINLRLGVLGSGHGWDGDDSLPVTLTFCTDHQSTRSRSYRWTTVCPPEQNTTQTLDTRAAAWSVLASRVISEIRLLLVVTPMESRAQCYQCEHVTFQRTNVFTLQLASSLHRAGKASGQGWAWIRYEMDQIKSSSVSTMQTVTKVQKFQ